MSEQGKLCFSTHLQRVLIIRARLANFKSRRERPFIRSIRGRLYRRLAPLLFRAPFEMASYARVALSISFQRISFQRLAIPFCRGDKYLNSELKPVLCRSWIT